MGLLLGSNKPSVDYILFGDSHSLSIKSTIDKLAKEKKFKILFLAASACLPFLDVYINRKEEFKRNCYSLNKQVFDYAEENNLKGIILSARWSAYTLGDYDFNGTIFISSNKDGPFTLDESLKTFKKSFNNTVDSYISLGIPIHIISQPPHQKHHPESVYFK